jgi:hypothetical protein
MDFCSSGLADRFLSADLRPSRFCGATSAVLARCSTLLALLALSFEGSFGSLAPNGGYELGGQSFSSDIDPPLASWGFSP